MKIKFDRPKATGLVLFLTGLAGCLVLAATLRQGFSPSLDVWLASCVIVLVIFYMRLSAAFERTRQELQMLRDLGARMKQVDTPGASVSEMQASINSTAEVMSRDVEMIERLRQAVDSDRVDLYLQPIVALPQNEPRFFEAFSRLRDANGAIIRPAQYLGAAERANRVGIIDNLILLRCVQALRNKNIANTQAVVFCNISPATLFDTEFFAQFSDYLESNADLAERLVFEFTWPAFQMMHPRVEKNIADIVAKGFSFSVDHLHTLDVDWDRFAELNVRYVKVNARLLMSRGPCAQTEMALRENFCRRLSDQGVNLIAEKIESEQQVENLSQLGIAYGQGNYFGAPQSAEYYLNNMKSTLGNSDRGNSTAVSSTLAKAS